MRKQRQRCNSPSRMRRQRTRLSSVCANSDNAYGKLAACAHARSEACALEQRPARQLHRARREQRQRSDAPRGARRHCARFAAGAAGGREREQRVRGDAHTTRVAGYGLARHLHACKIDCVLQMALLPYAKCASTAAGEATKACTVLCCVQRTKWNCRTVKLDDGLTFSQHAKLLLTAESCSHDRGICDAMRYTIDISMWRKAHLQLGAELLHLLAQRVRSWQRALAAASCNGCCVACTVCSAARDHDQAALAAPLLHSCTAPRALYPSHHHIARAVLGSSGHVATPAVCACAPAAIAFAIVRIHHCHMLTDT